MAALLLGACSAFSAEPAAEVLEPDDAPPPPATPQVTTDNDPAPAAPAPATLPAILDIKPAKDETPGPVVADDAHPAPVNPPLEIDEPGFKAKVTYRMEGTNADSAPEQKPVVLVRDWALAEEDGVVIESDPIEVDTDTQEVSPLLARAMAKEKNRKPGESIAAYEAVVEAEPDNVEALYQLGVAQVKAGEAAKGAATLEKAVVKNPKNARFLCAYGQAALQAGLHERALAATQSAAVMVPSDARYQSAYGDVLLAIGKLPEAAAAYSRAIAIDKGNSPAYIYNLGLVHLHCRDFKKAIQVFDEAIRQKKDYAPYYCSRGLAYENLKQIKQAGQDYMTAIKIDKNNAYAHFLLAGIYSDPDDPTYTNKFEAVSHAEKAVKLTEFKNARYLMGLARALRVAFNYEEAVIAARKAIQIDPRPEYQQELAKYQAQLKQEGAFLKDGKK